MPRNTHRTSCPSSNDECISWFNDKSWLMQYCPGLKTDWFVEIRWFAVKNQGSCRAKWDLPVVCQRLFVIVFVIWNNICFFWSSEKISLSKYDLKMISRGLCIDGSHIFNNQMSISLNQNVKLLLGCDH